MNKQWIFIISKKLSDDSFESIQNQAEEMLKSWDSHGCAVGAELKTYLNQILVVNADDDQMVSGCAIDSLRNNLSKILSRYDSEIVSSNYVPIISDDQLFLFDRKEVKDQIKAMSHLQNLRVIDYNLLHSNLDGIASISIPVDQSWLAQ